MSHPPEANGTPPSTFTNVLLGLTSLALCGLVLCAVGWYRASLHEVALTDLTAEQRQGLVETMVQVSPGAHRWAFFEPRLAYTLRPDSPLEIWNSTFVSNSLGYRTAPPEKRPGTFRIVFVGDSWTYGMGVERQESYPEVLARLANEHAGLSSDVEAWTLALPGYNLHNSLAGLDFFFNTLQPDAVVVAPSGNDNHSSNTVLPNGSQWGDGLLQDELGEPHQLTYRARRLDTYRFEERWRQAFDRLRRTEVRLAAQGLPLYLFFVARWQEVDVHGRVAAAGLEAPYTIVPMAWTLDPWTLPPPIGHGSPQAQRLYARLLYRGLAQRLDWPPLPPDPSLDTPAGETRVTSADIDRVPLFAAPPPGRDWSGERTALARDHTRRLIPSGFRPPVEELAQVAGPIDPHTGMVGRAATVLVRPAAADRWLTVTVSPLPDAPFLYPMEFEVRIASAAGGSRVRAEIDADLPEQRLSLPIPADIPTGAALDVIMVAENSISSPQVLAGQSLIVREISTSPEVH